MKWELTQEVNNHAYFRYEFVCYRSERARAFVCVSAQIARSSLACDSWIWHTRNGLWIEGALFFMDKSDRREKKHIYWNKSCSTRLKSKSRLDVWRDTFNTFAHLRKFFFYFIFSNTIDRSIWRFYVKYYLVVKSKIHSVFGVCKFVWINDLWRNLFYNLIEVSKLVKHVSKFEKTVENSIRTEKKSMMSILTSSFCRVSTFN